MRMRTQLKLLPALKRKRRRRPSKPSWLPRRMQRLQLLPSLLQPSQVSLILCYSQTECQFSEKEHREKKEKRGEGRRQNNQTEQKNKGCFNCGGEGHLSRDCPEERKPREPRREKREPRPERPPQVRNVLFTRFTTIIQNYKILSSLFCFRIALTAASLVIFLVTVLSPAKSARRSASVHNVNVHPKTASSAEMKAIWLVTVRSAR